MLLTPGLPGAVHGDLHALGVDGEDGGGARDEDAQVEALAAPAAADEAEVVEFGHVVLQIRYLIRYSVFPVTRPRAPPS